MMGWEFFNNDIFLWVKLLLDDKFVVFGYYWI